MGRRAASARAAWRAANAKGQGKKESSGWLKKRAQDAAGKPTTF